LPAAKDLARVRFASPLKVRAIAAPDRLLESDDGGQSFHESASRPADFKSPTDWLGRDPLHEETSIGRATLERLIAAYAHHSVASDTGAEVGGIRLRDGTWVWAVEWIWDLDLKGANHTDARYVEFVKYVSIRRPDGSIVDTRALGNRPLLPWGDRLLLDGYDHELQVVYPLNEPPIPKLPKFARSGSVFADPAGRYILADAEGQYAFQDKNSEHTLLLYDGIEWQVYKHIVGAAVAISEKWLLLCGPTCRIVPLWNPELSGFVVSLESTSRGSFQLLNDGIVYLRSAESADREAKSELVYQEIGPMGLSRETAHNIAPKINTIAFADRLHGVAGIEDKRAYTTNDGGNSWTPIDGINLGMDAAKR
jgi:hypothetical protein